MNGKVLLIGLILTAGCAILSAGESTGIVSGIFVGIFILYCIRAVFYPIKGVDKSEDDT